MVSSAQIKLQRDDLDHDFQRHGALILCPTIAAEYFPDIESKLELTVTLSQVAFKGSIKVSAGVDNEFTYNPIIIRDKQIDDIYQAARDELDAFGMPCYIKIE